MEVKIHFVVCFWLHERGEVSDSREVRENYIASDYYLSFLNLKITIHKIAISQFYSPFLYFIYTHTHTYNLHDDIDDIYHIYHQIISLLHICAYTSCIYH